jgi:putative effector of murein hydrolase
MNITHISYSNYNNNSNIINSLENQDRIKVAVQLLSKLY